MTPEGETMHEPTINDAATVLVVRQELEERLQDAAAPGFAGANRLRDYLNSGRVDEATKALGRLTSAVGSVNTR